LNLLSISLKVCLFNTT